MLSESKEQIEETIDESVSSSELGKLHKAIVKGAIKGINNEGYATNVILKGERISKDALESENTLAIDIRYDDVMSLKGDTVTQDELNLYAKAHFEECDRELIKFIYGYIKQECHFPRVSFKKKDYAHFTKGAKPSFESKSVVQFEMLTGAKVNVWLNSKFGKYHIDQNTKVITFEVVVDININITDTMEEEMENQAQTQTEEIISEAVATKPVKLPSTSKCAKEYITKFQKHGFVIDRAGNQDGKLKTLKLDKDTSFFIVGGETYSGFTDGPLDSALYDKKLAILEKELPKISKDVFGVDVMKYIGKKEIDRAMMSVTRNIVMIGDVDMGDAVGIQLPNGLTLKVMIYITQGWGELRFYLVCRLEGASTKKADKFDTFPKFTIGTILRGTYGYNCTRNVFFKIVNRVGDVVYLSQLKSEVVDGDAVEGMEIPSKREVGKFIKARIKDDRNEGGVYPTSLGFGLYLWNGKPCEFNSD